MHIITEIYTASLQGNLLGSAPNPTLIKQCGLKDTEQRCPLASGAAQPGDHSRLLEQPQRRRGAVR